MSEQVPVDEFGRTNPEDATVTLETRFGPDYITVHHTERIDGARMAVVSFDETTDPLSGFQFSDMSFHADSETQGISQLVAFRDALNAAIEYLRQP